MSTVIKGQVTSGVHEAGHFTSLDWVKQQCIEKLGFSPWPGTLNLKLEETEEQAWQEVRQQVKVFDLQPPSGSVYCPALVYPTRVGNIPCAAVVPLIENYPGNVLELLSQVHLRRELQLTDGEEVMLVFNCG